MNDPLDIAEESGFSAAKREPASVFRVMISFRTPPVLALTGCLLSGSGAIDPCRNAVVAESKAPGGEAKVVVFARDCGATTAVSTQISVMDASARFTSRASWFQATGSGNVFVADTDHERAPSGAAGGPRVNAVWLDSKHLRIVYDKSARVFLAVKEAAGVTIEYADGHQ